MKLLHLSALLTLIFLTACSTPRGIKEEEAKPHWDTFYNELMTNCKNTKGTKISNPPIKSKPYFYSCVVQRRARQTKTSSFSLESPFHGFKRGTNKMLSGYLNNYLINGKFDTGKYFSRHSIQDYNKYWYSQWMLKNGYTLFSFGKDSPFDKYWRRYVDVIFARVEGYSSNEYPTEAEITGKSRDVPESEYRQHYNEMVSQIQKHIAQEKSVNENISARTRAKQAERARKRRQRNREIRESNNRDFREFYMKTVGAMRSSPNYAATASRPSYTSSTPKPSAPAAGTRTTVSTPSNIRPCSIQDKSCIPSAYSLCRHKNSKNYSCHPLDTYFKGSIWASKLNSRHESCRQKSRDASAVAYGSFSKNSAFTSGRDYQSNDPRGACIQKCRSLAAKEKVSCLM